MRFMAETTSPPLPAGELSKSAARDIASSIHPYTNLKTHASQGPLVVTEGDGVFVRDENGKTYLKRSPDCGASAWDFPSAGLPKPRIGKC